MKLQYICIKLIILITFLFVFQSISIAGEKKDLADFRDIKTDYIERAKKHNTRINDFNEFLIIYEKDWQIFYRQMTNHQIDTYTVYMEYNNNESLDKLLKSLNQYQQISFNALKEDAVKLTNINSVYLSEKKNLAQLRQLTNGYAQLIKNTYPSQHKIVQEANTWLSTSDNYLVKYYQMRPEVNRFMIQYGGKGLDLSIFDY